MGIRLVEEYFERIALGKRNNVFNVYKFGRNELVTDTEELIAAGGVYGLPSVADTVTVISDDVVNDNPTGAGARTVKLFGLDVNYDSIDEIVELGGTSTKEFIRVFRAFVETAGNLNPTGGANVGTITISQTVGDDMILINPNDGQSLCACFTIPAGYTALMWAADTTVGSGKESTNRLKSREFNSDQPFRTKGIRDNFENSVGVNFKIPSKYPEKTDVVFTSISTAAGTSVSGTFLLQLIKNEG